MPRVAKTDENGNAEFITDEVPLPVTDISSRTTHAVLLGIEKQLILLNARIEECFNTSVPVTDAKDIE